MVDKGQRFGPYVTQRRLGAGGMAEAWMAVHKDDSGFEHRVCLKFIHDSFRNDREFVGLFMNEAAIAALLRHSNIVGVIGANPADGYMALELVDGCDLRAILHDAPQRRLPAPLVAHIAIHLCEALQYAHTRTKAGTFHGIVHRDISPGNVLVSYAGEVKLTDFGIAKAMRSTGDVGSAIKGKFSYMSPEQATGAAIDGRSDLFSLGTMLYELLAGQRPFDGASELDTLRRVAEADHTPLAEVAPDVPEGIAGVVESLLKRDPDARPDSAAAVLRLLDAHAPPPSVCFELGRVAQSTRPHETLTVPGALSDALTTGAGAGPGESQVTDTQGPTPVVAALPAREEMMPTRTSVDTGTAAPDARGGRRTLALAGAALAVTVVAGLWALSSTLDDAGQPLLVSAATDGPAIEASSPARTAAVARAPRPGTGAQARGVVATAGAGAADTSGAQHVPGDGAARTGTARGQPEAEGRPAAALPLPQDVQGAETGAETAEGPQQPAPHAVTARGRGEIKVLVAPFGDIWLDARPAGRAPKTLEVSPGKHTVSVGRGEPERRQDVRVRAGGSRTVKFVL